MRIWDLLSTRIGHFGSRKLIQIERRKERRYCAYFVKNAPFLESLKKTEPIISEALKFAMLIALFIGLCIETIYDFRSQLHRLSIVLITMLIMTQKSSSYLLELKPMIVLGDCSYSVYLIHWPLFTLHRYYFPSQYDRDHDYATFVGKSINVFLNYYNFVVGIQLIFTSIVLGYLMEEMFKFAIRWLRTWVSLLPVVFSMYFVIGILLVLVAKQKPAITHVSFFD